MAGERARRERLDQILVARGLVESRAKAQAMILAGRVRSGEVRLDKPGVRLPLDLPLALDCERSFVSRGGPKLEAGLRGFALAVVGRDALDVGASTGGFTEALLRAGARRVIALDVGRGQLDWTLRTDSRVVPVEGLNARYLRAADLPFLPSLATVDVSFISLALVLPAVVSCLADGAGDVVALVKPQFEVGRGQVGRGGIVRDAERHREVLLRITARARGTGWQVAGILPSPLLGAEGNREFLLHLRIGAAPASPPADAAGLVEAALALPTKPLAPRPTRALRSGA